MRRVILSLILACAASGFALAQEPAQEPAAKPDAAAPSPPEATPTMKAPEEAGQPAPSAGAGTQESVDTTAAPAGSAKFTVTEEAAKEWMGRPVYSSDNKKLGEITALQRDPDNTVSELRADIGGFLGFGETRVRITADQIKEVKDDSLVLTLTEAEAKSLPAIDKE